MCHTFSLEECWFNEKWKPWLKLVTYGDKWWALSKWHSSAGILVVVYQYGSGGWCAGVGGVGGALKWVALVTLEQIPGCSTRQHCEWHILSQNLFKNLQERIIV